MIDNFELLRELNLKYQCRGLGLLHGYMILNPLSGEDIVDRRGTTGKTTSFLDQLVSRLMTRRKENSGKKSRVVTRLRAYLLAFRDEHFDKRVSLSTVIGILVAISTPDQITTSAQYGSGRLIRACWATFRYRINWFMKLIATSRKQRNFARRVTDQFRLILKGSSSSMVLTAKKSAEAAAQKANIPG